MGSEKPSPPAKKWYTRRLVPLTMFVLSLVLMSGALVFCNGLPGHYDVEMNRRTQLLILFLILMVSSLIWLFISQLARLNQSRENLRLTIESSTDIVVLLDAHARYVEIFATGLSKLVAPPEDIRGKSIREVMGDELGDRVEKAITEVLANDDKQSIEYSLVLNGKLFWFEAIISPRDIRTVVATIRDITREKNLSLELAEQRRFMEKVLDSISDPIFIKNDRHEWLYGNDAFSAFLGRRREEYYGKTDEAFFPEEVAKKFYESDDQMFQRNQEYEVEEVKYQLGEEPRSILTKKTPFTDNLGKRTLVGIIRDITDRKRMERQLQEERARQIAASRMASLGEMAGGVAHEINNPLAIVSGYTARLTDILNTEPLARDRAHEIIRRIETTTTRIATIVKGLRAISRDGGFDPKEMVRVESIVQDTLGLCFERFRNNGVTIETNLQPDAVAYCRSVQISQVLLNLLTNAFFAASKFPNPKVSVSSRQDGDFVEIAVTDSGTGVDPSLRERIFEPFFTTKPVGMGTGLGLSIAASIVRDHSGELFLDQSSPATRFVIRLPSQPLKA